MNDFSFIDKLYHYTSFEAACKIIVSKSLLMSSLDKMNDVNESFRWLFSNSDVGFPSWSKVAAHFRQLSLSQDTSCCPGFRILPMWGFYAQKGLGVCLVFDKRELLSCINKDKAYAGPVLYKHNYNSTVHFDREENILSENIRKLLFSKDDRWSFEQEYRILSHAKSYTKLPFGNSLKYAIIYAHDDNSIWDSSEYGTLLRLLGDEKRVLAYGNFMSKESLSYLQGSYSFPVWKRELSCE